MATLSASFLQLDGTSLAQTLSASWLQLQGAPIVSIPADPSAVAGDATSDTAATITWQDNSGNELGFEVQIEEPAGSGNWVSVGGDANPTANGVQSFNATGIVGPVVAGRVRSFNAAGAGNWVPSAQFGMDNPGGGGGGIVPGALVLFSSWLQLQGSPVASVPADVSNVVGDGTSDTTATVTWQDNSGDELGFNIQLEIPAGSGNWVTAVGDANPAAPGVLSFNATGLSQLNPVLVPRVRSFGAAGPGNWVMGAQFALDNPGGGGAPIPIGFTGQIAAVERVRDRATIAGQLSKTHYEQIIARETRRDRARVIVSVASSRVSGGMLASLAAEFTASRSQVGLFIDYVQVLDCAIRATRFYSGWAKLDDPTSNLGVFTITGATTVLPDEWAIIFPLFVLYVERETAVAIESSRVAGVDAVGRDSSSVEGDIRQLEAELPQKAYVEGAWSVGFPSTVP